MRQNPLDAFAGISLGGGAYGVSLLDKGAPTSNYIDALVGAKCASKPQESDAFVGTLRGHLYHDIFHMETYYACYILL